MYVCMYFRIWMPVCVCMFTWFKVKVYDWWFNFVEILQSCYCLNNDSSGLKMEEDRNDEHFEYQSRKVIL